MYMHIKITMSINTKKHIATLVIIKISLMKNHKNMSISWTIQYKTKWKDYTILHFWTKKKRKTRSLKEKTHFYFFFFSCSRVKSLSFSSFAFLCLFSLFFASFFFYWPTLLLLFLPFRKTSSPLLSSSSWLFKASLVGVSSSLLVRCRRWHGLSCNLHLETLRGRKKSMV